MGQLLIKHRSVNLSLNRKHEAPLSHGESICEVSDDTFFRQRGEMLRIDLDFFQYGGWAEWLTGLICGITDLGHPSCDVNEPCDLGVISGLGDDGAAPRVPNENHRTVLHSDDAAGRICVVRQRCKRILNGHDVKAARFKNRDYFCPTRAVRKSAVDENDVFDRLLLRLSRTRPRDSACHSHASCNETSCQNTFNDLLHRILLFSICEFSKASPKPKS